MDYVVIQPSPYQSSWIEPIEPGQIELIEVGLYTSFFGVPDAAAQREFRTKLKKWLAQNAKRVRYVRVPCVYGTPHSRLQARTFYALEALGGGNLHERFEFWAKQPEHDPIYHNMFEPDEQAFLKLNLAFVKKMGLDERQFEEIYRSPSLAKKIDHVASFTSGAGLLGTPTFIVYNGKHALSTSAQRLRYPQSTQREDLDRLLMLLEHLATWQ